MKQAMDVPTGYLPVWMDGGGVLVIPMAVYVAGLKLGKMLQRRAALARRMVQTGTDNPRRGNKVAGEASSQ